MSVVKQIFKRGFLSVVPEQEAINETIEQATELYPALVVLTQEIVHTTELDAANEYVVKLELGENENAATSIGTGQDTGQANGTEIS